MSDIDQAEDAKVGFYTRPDQLAERQVDPLIWPAVKRINESGWVWTAESCQGHPDDTGVFGPWAGNTRPMLRLVCRVEHFGGMLALLLDAAWWVHEDVPGNRPNVLEFCPTHKSGGWRGVLVYVRAATVGDRRLGLDAFERFGEAVNGANGDGA